MNEAQQLLNDLSKKLMLVRLRISWPKLQRSIQDAVVEVPGAGEITRELRNNPQWSILPQEWKDRYQKLESKARTYLHQQSIQPNSVRSPVLLDLDVIPVHKAAEIFDTLKQYNAELQEIHNEFVPHYLEVLARVKEVVGEEVFAKLERSLPSKCYLKHMAYLSWGVLPISTGYIPDLTPIISKLSEHTDTQDIVDELTTIQERLDEPVFIDSDVADVAAQETRRQLTNMAESLAESVFTEPRAAFAEGVQHLLRAIESGKQIRNGTLDIVRRACDTLRNFDFVADRELLTQLDRVSDVVESVNITELNSDSEVGNALAEVLRGAYKQATNKEAAATTLSNFRRIRLD